MAEALLFRLMQWIESWGVWLSWLAWATVLCGAVAMHFAVRGERWRRGRRIALAVGLVSFAAHLADYAVTLHRSPDLALEANPLWRNIVDAYGLAVAKWYGFSGKLLLSILGGQMAAFYGAEKARLFPADGAAAGRGAFLRGIGSRSRTLRERLLALFTLFCFFFAGLGFFYFYIAFQNGVTDPAVHDALPQVPTAVVAYVAGLGAAFIVLTYRAWRGQPHAVAAAGGAR